MFFLGIDLGATFIKGAILDVEARALRGQEHLPFPSFTTSEDLWRREVDPHAIIKSVKKLIKLLLGKEPRCEGIFFTGQMHGLILCNASGEPCSPFISWQDQRALASLKDGATPFSKIWNAVGVSKKAALGNELKPGLPICFLATMSLTKALPSKCYPCSLVDFVIANLRHSIPVADITNAAASGFLNLKEKGWDQELIEIAGISSLLLPEVVSSGIHLGEMVFEGSSLKIFSGIGDHQAALLGVALGKEELSINIATGSQVTRICDQFEEGDFQLRPYVGNQWIKTITHLPAGRALNSLFKLFAQEQLTPNLWQQLIEEGNAVSSTDLKVNLCFFETSIGNRGFISNLHEGNMSRGHVVRAALHTMAENYYTAALKISPAQNWIDVLLSGGVAHKIPILRQEIGSFFGKNMRLSSDYEDALLGLLRLAPF